MDATRLISIEQAEMVLEEAIAIFLDMEDSLGFEKHEEFLDPRELTEAIRLVWAMHFRCELDTTKMHQIF